MTDLQLLASRENYALFQLRGMLSNVVHITRLLGPQPVLVAELHDLIVAIKVNQYCRIQQKEIE